MPVFDADGFTGRCDFGWREHGVVGEFDGKIKYQRDGYGGLHPEQVVWREKLREDRMRATGLGMVRWTTVDLAHPQRFRRMLLSAFAQHRT